MTGKTGSELPPKLSPNIAHSRGELVSCRLSVADRSRLSAANDATVAAALLVKSAVLAVGEGDDTLEFTSMGLCRPDPERGMRATAAGVRRGSLPT